MALRDSRQWIINPVALHTHAALYFQNWAQRRGDILRGALLGLLSLLGHLFEGAGCRERW